MGRASEFFQKAGIMIGFVVPMLFDRDVGGALASALLGFGGVVFGMVLGYLTIRRNFN